MKWIRTALCALGMLACLSLSAFAAELGEPNITEQTTMKELRENPSIKGSGFYTYCTSRPTRMRQAYAQLCSHVGETTAQKLTGLDGTEYLV